jgi:hypothetical protein
MATVSADMENYVDANPEMKPKKKPKKPKGPRTMDREERYMSAECPRCHTMIPEQMLERAKKGEATCSFCGWSAAHCIYIRCGGHVIPRYSDQWPKLGLGCMSCHTAWQTQQQYFDELYKTYPKHSDILEKKAQRQKTEINNGRRVDNQPSAPDPQPCTPDPQAGGKPAVPFPTETKTYRTKNGGARTVTKEKLPPRTPYEVRHLIRQMNNAAVTAGDTDPDSVHFVYCVEADDNTMYWGWTGKTPGRRLKEFNMISEDGKPGVYQRPVPLRGKGKLLLRWARPFSVDDARAFSHKISKMDRRRQQALLDCYAHQPVVDFLPQ